jgi:hypothetical protein
MELDKDQLRFFNDNNSWHLTGPAAAIDYAQAMKVS